MTEPGRTPSRRILFRWPLWGGALLPLVVLSYGLWHFVIKDFRDFTKVPLDQSPYLRDVAEPITLIRGPHEAASDSVWMGIVFVDAKHVERYAEYVIHSYDPVEIPGSTTLGTVERRDTLMLGTARNIKPVPAGGADERAFLGLLQRWYRHDAEARELTNSSRRDDFSRLTEQQKAIITGVAMMRRLLARNWVP